MPDHPPRQAPEIILRALFDAALSAARPEGRFAGQLPARPEGRTIVLGAGKAAASMAAAFEAAWPHGCEGLVVTRYGHRVPTRIVEVVEAAHPVPDAAGLAATDRIIDLARAAGPDDLVVALVSGGASALLTKPAEGVTFAEKQDISRALLRSGAPISAMNLVRRHLSAVKGGRLATLVRPARLATYLISDVPGDDPAVIGSGPTIPAPADPAGVMAILRRHGIALSRSAEATVRGAAGPTGMGPDDTVHLIASPRLALEAAAAEARRRGIEPIMLGDAIEGEAREVGAAMAREALDRARALAGTNRACVLLSGGETTVTVRGQGRGGRNAEFLLALALSLDGAPGIAALACDTDGIDGSEDNAGAWCDPGLIVDASRQGVDLRRALDGNDAYAAFAALDRLVVTGPTHTNVNDFRAILLGP